MDLSDAELRTMVRSAITRLNPPDDGPGRGEGLVSAAQHASHGRLPVRAGGPGVDGEDGACVIEPSVRCTHCGYCQSYGH